MSTPSAPCRAAVVRHRFAAELAGAGFEIRIVDEHDGHFAAHVDALIVVPLTLGSGNSVTQEHERRILDLHALDVRGCRAYGDVLALREGLVLAAARNAESDRASDVELRERNVLRPGARSVLQIATRLQAGGFHLLGQVRHGLLFARSGRAAAFEGIRGKRLDVRGEPGRVGCHIGGMGEWGLAEERDSGRNRQEGFGGRGKDFHEAENNVPAP
jgi:hypothetical protein